MLPIHWLNIQLKILYNQYFLLCHFFCHVLPSDWDFTVHKFQTIIINFYIFNILALWTCLTISLLTIPSWFSWIPFSSTWSIKLSNNWSLPEIVFISPSLLGSSLNWIKTPCWLLFYLHTLKILSLIFCTVLMFLSLLPV